MKKTYSDRRVEEGYFTYVIRGREKRRKYVAFVVVGKLVIKKFLNGKREHDVSNDINVIDDSLSRVAQKYYLKEEIAEESLERDFVLDLERALEANDEESIDELLNDFFRE